MILVDKNSAFQIIGVLKVLKFLSFAVKSRSKTEMKKILTAFTRAREQVSIDYFFSECPELPIKWNSNFGKFTFEWFR